MRQYFWANLWILKLSVVVVINAVRVNVSQSDFTALEIQTVAGTYSEHWKWKLLSCVIFFATQWPIQSMEFPNPGIEPRSPALWVDYLPDKSPGHWWPLKTTANSFHGVQEYWDNHGSRWSWNIPLIKLGWKQEPQVYPGTDSEF